MGRPRIYDETLRERLVDEARKMLSVDGYHGVSLRVLTRNVETSTNAVYTLFGSKEALMAEVVIRDLDRLFGDQFDPNPSESSHEDLLKFSTFYRKHAIADPLTFAGTFEAMEEARRPGSLTDRINPEAKNIAARIHAPLLALCQRIADEVPEKEMDPQLMAAGLWALLHGYVSLENAHALPLEEDEVEAAFEQSVHALYNCWVSVVPSGDKPELASEDEQAATD